MKHPHYLVVVSDKEGYAFTTISDALRKISEAGGTLYATVFTTEEALDMDELQAHEVRRQAIDRERDTRNSVLPQIRTRGNKYARRRPFLGIPDNLWKKFHL